VTIGAEGSVFTYGIELSQWDSPGVRLQDVQNGYEQWIPVDTSVVEGDYVFRGTAADERLITMPPHTVATALVRFNALTASLPFGVSSAQPLIPGGVQLHYDDNRRTPWLQAGPLCSYSKEQLFVLQPGEMVVFGSLTRKQGVELRTVATLVCHKQSLVLRFPKPYELQQFWKEQHLWAADWCLMQDIYNPHR
jgi:hypothetical protein